MGIADSCGPQWSAPWRVILVGPYVRINTQAQLEKPPLRLLMVAMKVVLFAKCSKIIQIVIPARKAGLLMIHFEAEGALTWAT